IYRKKQLRELDRRIRYLQKRLDRLKVVDRVPSDPERVFFGAWVTLEEESGSSTAYRIVGADEIDGGEGWISVDSPVARALLGKRLDDEVSVPTPGGLRRFWVTDIAYRR
ncbi:MAG: GreA/GreB family elongation factor, partial [Wenzhouxiangella sp.]|nr:GreA/GreB family elongation factor [Wenzhouxiangella sp.]